jgi:hypothetical protein
VQALRAAGPIHIPMALFGSGGGHNSTSNALAQI